MSWTEVAPIVTIIPNAKASIRVLTKRGPKLTITFSEPFFREMGAPKRANVLIGHTDTQGKVLIRIDNEAGKFEVREYEKGGGKITDMPLPIWAPDGHRESEACTTEKTPEGWIISLPLSAWQVDVAKPKPVAQHPIPVLAPLKAVGSAPLNAEKYLRSRGWKCTKLSSASFTLDGERVTINEILKQVNQERIEQKLPTLMLEGIE